MGPTEQITEDGARDRLVAMGAHAGVLDAAMKYLERVETIATASVKVEDLVGHVRRAVPRLTSITNLTVISLAFLEGAWTALGEADCSAENDNREIAEHYRRVCEWTVVNGLIELLDRDDRVDSFQSVHRCLRYPEVVDALVRVACEYHWEPETAEERLRHSVNEFLRIFGTINWRLHGRLTHFRNLGIAHLGAQLRERPTYDELRDLVRLVRNLAAHLEPLTEGTLASVSDDEIEERTRRASGIWRAVLSRKDKIESDGAAITAPTRLTQPTPPAGCAQSEYGLLGQALGLGDDR